MLFWVSHPPTAVPFKTHSKITGYMEQAFKLDSSPFEGNKTQGMIFTSRCVKEHKQKKEDNRKCRREMSFKQ